MELIHALSAEDIEAARALFVEYQRSLGVDLAFQGFEREVAELPGSYAAPSGRLLLAREDGRFHGCVALRGRAGGACEMKRLYVGPELRGRGVGRMLARAIIEEAAGIGYQRMRLDTLPFMTAAMALYRSLGFVEIPPYYPNPIEGSRFMELQLQGGKMRG